LKWIPWYLKKISALNTLILIFSSFSITFVSVFQNFFFLISSIHSFSEIRLYRTKFSIYYESQKVVSQKLLFCFHKKDISELQTFKHVYSIPALHKQYDIKMIAILQYFPKLIAKTLNSFSQNLSTTRYDFIELNGRYVNFKHFIFRNLNKNSFLFNSIINLLFNYKVLFCFQNTLRKTTVFWKQNLL
jgi:hypothetical protein